MDNPIISAYKGYVHKLQPLVYSNENIRGAVILIVCIISAIIICLISQCGMTPARAEETTLKASWYSVESLKKEGTYKYSKGVMANGRLFDDNAYICANRLYPLGTMLRITNLKNGKTIIVKTTDRIGKRFARSRVDLSRLAFSAIAELSKGVIPVKVERLI